MTFVSEEQQGTGQTVGARIADLLQAEGVEVIFSICDFSYNEIHKRASEIGMRVVGPRHESAGVHMADGLARMTGRPQVVMAGMGGVGNLVPGVATAFLEHVPVVVIAAQRLRATHTAVKRGRFQYMPQIKLFESVVKYAALVDGAHRIDEIVREAFRQANSGVPGPVYIEVPQDVMAESREFPAPLPPSRYRVGPEGASDDRIEEAADLLRGARLPLIIAGTGIHTSRTHAEVARLAEVLGCPVLPTPGGRGAVPHTHPQQLDFFLPPGEAACREADCVLALGTSIGEPLAFGQPPVFGPDQRWIYVDRDPGVIGVNREIEVPLVGDLRAILPQLTSALEKRGPFEPVQALRGWRAEQEEALVERVASAPETVPVHPGRAMAEAREAIPDDAVLVLDGGCTGLWEALYGQQRSTDFLWTSKVGQLGTGLPYAIGAQIAVGPERRVCLVSGDGALGFNVMELETAVRQDLPILVVVNHDRHWGMERLLQFMEIGKLIENEMAPVRYDEMARAVGAYGELCTTTEEIRPAIARALESGKPAVVQIMTDPDVNQLPPLADKFATWYEGNY